MATMYITEYKELAEAGRGYLVQAGQEPSVNQKVTFTGTAGQSAAFASTTRFVRISCDTAGFLLFGADPTAVTATNIPIAANTPEYFGVIGGQKVSAVT